MAGDAGQHVDARAGVDAEAQIARPGVDRTGDGEREGRLAEFGGVDAEEQVVHYRIADDHRVQHVAGIDAALRADLAGELRDGVPHRAGHLLAALGIHHDVGDAAHQILAEADLRVLHARRGDDAPRQERDEVHGDGGRADVAGDAVGLVVQARPERDDVGPRGLEVAVDGGGDAPVALAQDALDLRDEILRDEQVVPAPVLVQHHLQPVEIAERLVHVGLVHLDIAKLYGGVALDDPVDRRLAHHLGVDDGVLGHVDDEVALDGCRAGEAAALGQPADPLVALLLRTPGRDVAVGRDDLVLGEAAFLHHDLAAPAGRAAAAHALHVDPERARGIEHGRADRKAPALAGGHEQDEGVGGGGRSVHEAGSISEPMRTATR